MESPLVKKNIAMTFWLLGMGLMGAFFQQQYYMAGGK